MVTWDAVGLACCLEGSLKGFVESPSQEVVHAQRCTARALPGKINLRRIVDKSVHIL